VGLRPRRDFDRRSQSKPPLHINFTPRNRYKTLKHPDTNYRAPKSSHLFDSDERKLPPAPPKPNPPQSQNAYPLTMGIHFALSNVCRTRLSCSPFGANMSVLQVSLYVTGFCFASLSQGVTTLQHGAKAPHRLPAIRRPDTYRNWTRFATSEQTMTFQDTPRCVGRSIKARVINYTKHLLYVTTVRITHFSLSRFESDNFM
jgi:hypothetical protein